jgi:hypothetical protein
VIFASSNHAVGFTPRSAFPGRSAVRHASKSRPASSGDSQVDSIRTVRGSGKQDRIRTQIASRPYR